MGEKIYIHNSPHNLDFAKRLVNDLAPLGFYVTADFLNAQEARIEYEDATTFIVCLSQGSLQRRWFTGDVQYILQAKRRDEDLRVIPILVGDVFVSDLLQSPDFSSFADCSLIRFNSSYEDCLQDLLKLISRPKIFISYRPEDSGELCDQIYSRLITRFGAGIVVRDIDNIPLGIDFRDYLGNIMRQCAVALIIIGKEWAQLQEPATGSSLLANPADLVRLEIEAALKRNIAVVPVLVNGTTLPVETDLPASISGIVYRNGLSLRPDFDFETDVERLMLGIEAVLAKY